MWNILFLFSGLIFLLLLMIIFFLKPKINYVENKLFKRFVIANLIEYCVEIPLQFFVRTMDINNIFITVFTRLYIICIFTIFTIFTIYTYYICKKKENNNNEIYILKILFTIYYVINVLLLIFLPIKKYFDGSKMYAYGIAVDCLKIQLIIYVIFWIVNLLLNYKRIFEKKYFPVYAIIALIAANIFLQMYDPSILIPTVVATFICYTMYFTIENPDVKMLEQVEMAKVQAEKANNAKTEFLSSMSHEIRTPLNAIVGFSDCIEQANTLDEAKENAKDIINASNTLLEIVNGILDISKIEAGKLEINPSPYNSQEIFTEPATLIKPRMEEKGLDFSYYIAPDIPETLYGDHTNIKKIITNFLSNASKYTDKGYVKYEVNCLKLNDDVCRIIISVEDSGRGIKKEDINRLFSKFDRLEETRNTTIEGTGLGLAITKQLVEMMNGKIMVHTIYGEGSKFTCMIDQRISTEKVRRKSKKIDTSIDLENIKILLVDDNELNIKVERKLLETLNCKNIDYCYSGFECLEKNKSNTYDIILLDDMMPKMSGTETLKKLKENPSFKTPVVALTANAITGMRESYIAQGFSDYIAKPIEKETLITVMTRLIDVTSNIENPEEVEEKGEILNLEEPTPQEVNEPPKISDEEYLRSHGVDMDKALELLGDMEMYNETMKDFSDSLEEKWSKIEQEKLTSDMENYAIDVHALKSDCKYLGFYDLADVAYEHELKSKENDIDFVNENFEKLEIEYSKVLKIVKEYTTRI